MLEIVEDELSVGAVVAGRYRLERVVGKGGMGVVWAAREIASGRSVALKFLLDPSTDEKTRERFLREARAAMAMSHPHVARVEAVLETDVGLPFLVMELLEGESLRSHLRRRGILPPVEAARVLVPVVDAVACAHARRIVHRDLKPENVYIASNGHVRVLDFGIAKQLPKGDETAQSSLTSTGALLGTPVYMAPEQIFGDQDVDERADVWALGIIAYECLAGRRPTDGDGFGPIIRRITTDPIEPIERARPGVPRRLAQLVMRMLSRPRNERPSLAEVRDVLTAVIEAGDAAATVEAAPATVRMPSSGGPSPTRTTGTAPTVFEATAQATPAGAVAAGVPRAAPLAPPVGPPPVAPAPASPQVGFVIGVVSIAVAAISVVAGVVAFVAMGTHDPTIGPIDTDAGIGEVFVAARLLSEAEAAHKAGDGATCLAKLDAFDREVDKAKNGKKSTAPDGPDSNVRAMCVMRVGRCDEGRAMHEAWLGPAGAAADEAQLDRISAEECEGDQVSPRVAVLRAQHRMLDVAGGRRKATSAECESWRHVVESVAPTLPPADSTIASAAQTADLEAVTCLAAIPDCDGAFRVYREQSKRKYPAFSEKDVRRDYADFVKLTPCNGKP